MCSWENQNPSLQTRSSKAMVLEPLITPRLKIIPLSKDQLVMYLEEPEVFIRQIYPVSRNILTDTLRRAIHMKIERMASTPAEDRAWLTYWLIVITSEGYGAGMVGFKGAPDKRGWVEIGYGIDPDFQNRGYMTEAVQHMINWAFSDARCTRILAPDTFRSNLASNRVLQKVGMRVFEEKTNTLSWCLDRDWRVV